MHLCLLLLHWWMYPNLNLRTATSIWLMQDSGINHRGLTTASLSLSLSLPNTCSLAVKFFLPSLSLSVSATPYVATKLHLLSLKLWLFSFDFGCSCPPLYQFIFYFNWILQSDRVSLPAELHPNFNCLSSAPNGSFNISTDTCYLPTLALLSVNWLLARNVLNQLRENTFECSQGPLFLNSAASLQESILIIGVSTILYGSFIFRSLGWRSAG